MPELPQIEPVGAVKPAGAVPVSPGQGPAEVSKGIEDTSEKAVAVYKQIVAINRYNQFHQADAEMIVGQANIDKESRTISDPEGRVAYVQKANDNLIKQLTQKYPHAGPELGPQLLTRGAENVRQATAASVVLAHSNAMDNLATTEKTTQDAFSLALDDRDAHQILEGGHKNIDNYVANGAISLGDAEKAHYSLEYGAHLAAFNHAVDIDAVKVMDTPLGKGGTSWMYNGKEMNLNAVDYLTVQSRASKQENRQHDVAADQYKDKQNAIELKILDHSITPEEFSAADKAGFVSKAMYQYHTGQRQHFDIGGVEGALAGLPANASVQEIDQFQANYQKGAGASAYPATNAAVLSQLRADRAAATTRDGIIKRDLVQRAYDGINRKYGDDLYGPHPDPEIKAQATEMKNIAKDHIMGAKDTVEAQKYYDEHIKRLIETSPPAAAARITTGKSTNLTPGQTKKVAALPPPPGFK